jgi:hypothetical protein
MGRIDYTDYYGLIFRLSDGERAEQCVFRSIRSLPAQERIKYINRLTVEEKNQLVKNHQICLSNREY